MDIVAGHNWLEASKGTAIGILVIRDVSNPDAHSALEARKQTLVEELRARYSGFDRVALRDLPVLAAYHRFYKQFKKTYHLQLQLESVLEGKSIPSVAGLIEAMFMAELEDHLLTAGHDLDTVHAPITVDVSDGTQIYTRMNGKEQTLKSGDLYIADDVGVLSSVIYGPDARTRIQSSTRNAIFTTYAVPGIATTALRSHLERLRDYVLLISPEADPESLEIISR